MKLLTIIGARPQFVKAAALSREIKKHPQLQEIIVHTGQHFDANMSDIFFEEMDIPKPHYNLDINGLSHGAMTGQMLEKLEEVMIAEKPDVVLVYGDTNSTIAGALAAKKLHIKVAHVEAGLRSFNMQMPEEINRILTDRISDWLFCPTDTAINNLKNEGYAQIKCSIIKTGDVMEDAALFYAKKAAEKSTILQQLNLTNQSFILATIHRAENTDNPTHLKNIIEALNTLNQSNPVIVPLHPRTKKLIEQHQLKPLFTIVEPLGYFDMIMLLQNCSLVVTDSGGLQKEAFFFGKFCVTTREQTEWVELVENGYNTIAGTNKDKIIQLAQAGLLATFPSKLNLYGNGNACNNICQALIASI
ncbi:MAG: UDP-N-acetylglucosamine 2-epimerase (non-hydrolyzing) [Bacteroidia bacterium]|nr:UDP-N-acetylglucosamine 2-epimerase (non-hydrolyzing) [Bacteroidia bacterium]MBP9688509.1 UDP-N-acetylglucosamine 2-epimerase (non-hydrolyzing) [Bacteroidia bacterium]